MPRHGARPRANAVWCATKLAANAARDTYTDFLLAGADRTVVRVWEHDPDEAAERIRGAVAAKRRKR